MVTVEEHSIIGGLGGAVAEVMAEGERGARLLRLGTPDVFGESAMPDELLAKYGLTAEGVAQAVQGGPASLGRFPVAMWSGSGHRLRPPTARSTRGESR